MITCSSQRMSLRYQSSTWINHVLSAVGVVAVIDHLTGFADWAEAQGFVGDQFVSGKAVMKFNYIHICGLHFSFIEQPEMKVLIWSLHITCYVIHSVRSIETDTGNSLLLYVTSKVFKSNSLLYSLQKKCNLFFALREVLGYIFYALRSLHKNIPHYVTHLKKELFLIWLFYNKGQIYKGHKNSFEFKNSYLSEAFLVMSNPTILMQDFSSKVDGKSVAISIPRISTAWKQFRN